MDVLIPLLSDYLEQNEIDSFENVSDIFYKIKGNFIEISFDYIKNDFQQQGKVELDLWVIMAFVYNSKDKK